MYPEERSNYHPVAPPVAAPSRPGLLLVWRWSTLVGMVGVSPVVAVVVALVRLDVPWTMAPALWATYAVICAVQWACLVWAE